MIVLNVLYHLKRDARDRFLARVQAEGIDKASRAEKGNLRYDYFTPVSGGDELLLLEKWQDASALALHAGQPHFGKLKAIKDEYVISTEIERFEIPDEA